MSAAPLYPHGKLPRLSPWRQVSMETTAIMHTVLSALLKSSVLISEWSFLLLLFFNISLVSHRFSYKKLCDSNPVLYLFNNLFRYCNTSTKTSIHTQSNLNPRTLLLSPKGFNPLIPTFYYISHFLHSWWAVSMLCISLAQPLNLVFTVTPIIILQIYSGGDSPA